MKRTWIGAGLLALLLAAGLLMGAALENRLSPGAQKLRQAGEAALSSDWENAEALTESVRADWASVKPLAVGITSHDTLDQIEIAFDQLRSYDRIDGPSYSALCAALARQLEALGKAHNCSWENFF